MALFEKGLHAGALIKKHQYWLTLAPGDVIDTRFAGKATGEVEAIEGLIN